MPASRKTGDAGEKYAINPAPPSKVNDAWSLFTEDAASHYGVDEKLISAIISVESGVTQPW